MRIRQPTDELRRSSGAVSVSCNPLPSVAAFARRTTVNAGSSDRLPDHSSPEIAEPRLSCPRCGAHMIAEGRLLDRLLVGCPVCGLRWATEKHPAAAPATKHPTPSTRE